MSSHLGESGRPMTDEQLQEIAAALLDPEAAIACLPEAEQAAYRAAQQSVIDARRAGERLARELWIG